MSQATAIALTELNASFLAVATPGRSYCAVDSLEEADGVSFLCPKCFVANGGAVGTHTVICWFGGKVNNSETPGPGRWTPSGRTMADVTFTPSVHLSGPGCGWHGFVRDGKATVGA